MLTLRDYLGSCRAADRADVPADSCPVSSRFLDYLSFIPAVIFLLLMEGIPAAHLLVPVLVQALPITKVMIQGWNRFKFSVETFTAFGAAIK